MRARHFVLGFATSALVAGVIGIGCGGSSSDNGGTPDSGNADAPVDHAAPPVDTGTDAPKDSGPAACLTDADLNTFPAPDAALDDAGDTAATCIACTKLKCAPELTDCNNDCDCKDSLVQFYDCVQKGGTFQSCGSSFLGGNASLQALGLCDFSSCRKECGLSGFGQDAGKDAATDAPSDAPADGG